MVKFLIVFLWVYTIFGVEAGKSAQQCSINLSTDVKELSPIILTSSSSTDKFELFKPTGQISTFKEGSKLKVACTGKNNSFKHSQKSVLNVICKDGKFQTDLKKKLLKNTECTSVPRSSLNITKKRCFNNSGFIYEVGFTVENTFYGPVIEICYTNNTYTTFYTHNVLNGAAMKFSISESTRPQFSAKGMSLTTTAVNDLYKKENQIGNFKKYFGPKQTYVAEDNFLARGHLTPDADFIFAYEQFATYIYVNVAPEYQNINAGNWLRVEELAREISSHFGEDIDSYNGYIDALQLQKKGQKGDKVEVYLDSNKTIKVPKYFYKILLHKPTESSIVYVTLNNPHIEDKKIENICKDVCKESDWKHDNFPNTKKGYTICCKLDDFQKVVKTLPSGVEGNNLLKK